MGGVLGITGYRPAAKICLKNAKMASLNRSNPYVSQKVTVMSKNNPVNVDGRFVLSQKMNGFRNKGDIQKSL